MFSDVEKENGVMSSDSSLFSQDLKDKLSEEGNEEQGKKDVKSDSEQKEDEFKEALSVIKEAVEGEETSGKPSKKILSDDIREIYLDDFKEKSVDELLEFLEQVHGHKLTSYRGKQDILFKLVDNHIKLGGVVYGRGVLQILTDQNQGYGFLRSEKHNYTPVIGDIYVAQSQIRSLGLRTGDEIVGTIRSPMKENEKYFGLIKVTHVNGIPFTGSLYRRPNFEDLTPMFPVEKFNLEFSSNDVDTRIMDIFVPIGKGQRGMVVSQPKAGKTTLLKKIATAICKNHPEVTMFILLIDERPEEVTDWKRSIKNVTVISSTFDEEPYRHGMVAEMVLERAKRLVEMKMDVVILLDSLTRLTRAYNQITPPSGRIMSGGIEVGAFQKPKYFFGSARKMEEGGSLTIIASALIDTGSKMDEVIYEEFKGTGNMEVHLSRDLANKRIFPAIDLKLSGTRREELLLPGDKLHRIWLLRRAISDMSNEEIIQKLTDILQKTKNNDQFLENLQQF